MFSNQLLYAFFNPHASTPLQIQLHHLLYSKLYLHLRTITPMYASNQYNNSLTSKFLSNWKFSEVQRFTCNRYIVYRTHALVRGSQGQFFCNTKVMQIFRNKICYIIIGWTISIMHESEYFYILYRDPISRCIRNSILWSSLQRWSIVRRILLWRQLTS